MAESDALIAILKALGDPVRWQLLSKIAQVVEMSRKDLEETSTQSRKMTSYHCRILRQAELIEVHKRGREVFYRLRGNTMDQLSGQLAALGLGPRRGRPEGARKKRGGSGRCVLPRR